MRCCKYRRALARSSQGGHGGASGCRSGVTELFGKRSGEPWRFSETDIPDRRNGRRFPDFVHRCPLMSDRFTARPKRYAHCRSRCDGEQWYSGTALSSSQAFAPVRRAGDRRAGRLIPREHRLGALFPADGYGCRPTGGNMPCRCAALAYNLRLRGSPVGAMAAGCPFAGAALRTLP